MFLNHLNVETTDLLILPEKFNKKDKLLFKVHYDICPYWMKDNINKSIMNLKSELGHINPLYLGQDSFWNLDIKEIFKRLNIDD